MRLLRDWLEFLLPSACARCGRRLDGGGALCTSCDARLPRLDRDLCRLCQERIPSAAAAPCQGCAERRSPLRACLAAAAYGDEVARWVQRFKYPHPGILGLDPGPGAVLRQLLHEAAAQAPVAADVVVPIPLHPARLRQRGFNPAGVMARSLARHYRTRFAPCALERVRDTPSQTGLASGARRRNVAEAFRLTRGKTLPACVWLVDDVVTTGSTLEEAARVLRRAGVKTVVGLCAARTLLGS